MEQTVNGSQLRALSTVQIAVGLGILAFWVLFYTIGMAPAAPPPCYFAFEHSFLPPDLILAVALIASGINVLQNGRWGRPVALVCAGGLLFLGVIDLTFNIQNGMYSGPVAERLQAAAIPVICVAVGIWIFVVHGCALSGRPYDRL